MKIQVVYNTDLNVIKQGIEMAKAKCPFPLEFVYQPTTRKFTSVPLSTDVVISGYAVSSAEILQETANTNTDVSLLIYDPRNIYPQPTNPCTHFYVGEDTIQIPSTWFTDYQNNKVYPEVLCQFFLHELAHWVAHKLQIEDLTHYQNINAQFSQKPPIEYYVFLLGKYKEQSTTQTYKYFKASEVIGLKPELVQMLDKARELAGIPFSITSGYRTQNKNDAIGGVEDSSHIKGLAVDLRARNSREHYIITKALLNAGFRRISRKYPLHIHVDIDESKEQDILF